MRVTRTVIFLCLSIVLFLSCGQETEVKEAILTGRVTAQDTSVYLQDVKVYETSHNRLSTITDSAGYFRLEGVAFEEHNIYFEKEGYKTDTLWFEYTGSLTSPRISKLIRLSKIGEEVETPADQ
jgi:hypothetical protein